METATLLLNSFLNIWHPYTLIAMFFGVSWGILMGALPGFGGTLAMALLIPFTFGMNPNIALPMLASVYAGAMFGGGITSIMLGIPGTSAAAATIVDGFPMTKKGESNRALTTSAFASAFGGAFGGIVLLLFAPPLAKVSLKFGPPEYFVLAIFGLTIIASLSGKSILKGLISGSIGILLGTVGIDPISGVSRFTFKSAYLYDGLPLIPMVLALFAFPRFLHMIRSSFGPGSNTLSTDIKGGGPRILFRELRKMMKTILYSSGIGSLIGLIPGAGSNIACWVAYSGSKRMSKHPEKFGTGIPEGVAAAESANNAVEGGAMIPLLTLSIPGNAGAAIMLSALLIQGLVPGPDLFTKHADITYTYIMAVIFCNVVMFFPAWYASRFYAKVADVSFTYLAPLMGLMTLMGAFATRQYVFDVWITIIFGVVFFILSLAEFPMPPILLGMILGPIAEAGFKRALLISKGSYLIFVTRPICIVLIILAAYSVYNGIKMNRKEQEAPYNKS